MIWEPKDGDITAWSESATFGPFTLAIFDVGKVGPFGPCKERPQWAVMQTGSVETRFSHQVVGRGHTWGDLELAKRNAISGVRSVLREYKRTTVKGSEAREAILEMMGDLA